jgi:predicted AAA+ superfamily ATPase
LPARRRWRSWGPHQVGKTTLALELAALRPPLYLDLETPSDRAKLTDPGLFLSAHEDELVILDEIQRAPDLFLVLRGLIDRGRRVDLLLVRRLEPLQANVGKRLVKSPRLFVRDSGLVHALLGIGDTDALLGHPVAGRSWEGFVIENLLRVAPARALPSFYRTAAGAEVDLVLDLPGGQRWAVEVKLGQSPKLDRGFHHARADLEPTRSVIVHSGEDRYPLAEGVEAIGLSELARELLAYPKQP